MYFTVDANGRTKRDGFSSNTSIIVRGSGRICEMKNKLIPLPIRVIWLLKYEIPAHRRFECCGNVSRNYRHLFAISPR